MRNLAWSIVLAGTVLLAGSSQASDLVITGFTGNGEVTWSNVPNTQYRVEWASSLTAPDWTNSWTLLNGLTSTGNAVTVRVPVFYRVVGTQPPVYDFADYFPVDPNVAGIKTYEETEGHAVTIMKIYGRDTGVIATGNVDPSTGALVSLLRLLSVSHD